MWPSSLCVRQACQVCEAGAPTGFDKAEVIDRERKMASTWGANAFFADAQKNPEHRKKKKN